MRSMVSRALPRVSFSVWASAVEAFLAPIRWVAEYSPMPDARSSSYRPCSSSISTFSWTSPAGRWLCISAVGQPDPLQRHHQGPLGQLQSLRDLVAGVADLGLEHPRGRLPAAGHQVVIE